MSIEQQPKPDFDVALGCHKRDQHSGPSLSCDDVAWMQNALDRFERAIRDGHPACSRWTNAAKLAALPEIMEVVGATFADDDARHNAITNFPEVYWDRKTPQRE